MRTNIFNQAFEISVIRDLTLVDLWALACKKLNKPDADAGPTIEDAISVAWHAEIDIVIYQSQITKSAKKWLACSQSSDVTWSDVDLRRAVLMVYLMEQPKQQEQAQ